MSHRSRLAVLLLLLNMLYTGCMPIQPMVHDGAGAALPVRNDLVSAVTAVTEPGVFDLPYDSTPDPDGAMVYFTASGALGAGVYAVSSTGGETKALLTGAPFVTPRGLAMSSDGATIFVADPGAGQIWMLPSAGGAATVLAGSTDTAPVSVDVIRMADGGDMVYFAGAKAGKPGIWRVAASGGEATMLAEGAPLAAPMGIAATNDGALYVVDQQASGNGLGSVFRVKDGQIEPIAENFRAGYLAGAALTLDESVLLVSALDVQSATAQVLAINLTTLDKAVVTKVVSANKGCGGIHRAHNANVFSWADYNQSYEGQPIQKPGHVYVVRP